VAHPEEYGVVVLGSGRARFLAWSLASQEQKTVVVERAMVGGSCPNVTQKAAG
jgi:pyruvate/2-oxoglutarate dehydrogenase complex dihydrolipoamide dehydrogenase (E3) component